MPILFSAVVVRDLILRNAEVSGHGVHRALGEVHKAHVVVAQLHDLLERRLEVLVFVDRVDRGGRGLRHHALTGEVRERGETQKLIVGFDAEFPPFGFIAADGTYDGFDLAMAKELCARLGWEYEAVAIDWNSKDAELSSGTINCIWNGFTYTGRENDYTFSDPYVDNSIVMVVKAGSGITSLADLAGKSVSPARPHTARAGC